MQAVVFLLLNKRRGKDEVNILLEARDTAASKQREFAMENIMGQDSFHCIYKRVDTELILAGDVFHHLFTDFIMHCLTAALPVRDTGDIQQTPANYTSSLLVLVAGRLQQNTSVSVNIYTSIRT